MLINNTCTLYHCVCRADNQEFDDNSESEDEDDEEYEEQDESEDEDQSAARPGDKRKVN